MVVDLISSESNSNDKAPILRKAVQTIIKSNNYCSENSSIPWLVWLLENPDSIVALPGKITLYNHDCLHVILDRGFDLKDEAFVIGFTMGNDRQTNPFHLWIFKIFSRFFYPLDYRFSDRDLKVFELGILYGKKIKTKNINQIDFKQLENKTVNEIRDSFGIELKELKQIKQFEKWLIG